MTTLDPYIYAAAAAAGLRSGDYTVLVPGTDAHSQAEACLTSRFPIAEWGRVDWSRVSHSICRPWESLESASLLVNEIAAHVPLKKENAYVIWTNALRPILHVPVRALRSNLLPLMEIDWDMWIVDDAGKWCIEVYHEGELCFGSSPAPDAW
ncbi:hypothetical protein [Longimicrobium terrae]|uniref:CDI toxin immunity protein n=1 Tax=Longimicrobium terrae TaxID=1639882 RepID=UPI003B8378B2